MKGQRHCIPSIVRAWRSPDCPLEASWEDHQSWQYLGKRRRPVEASDTNQGCVMEGDLCLMLGEGSVTSDIVMIGMGTRES